MQKFVLQISHRTRTWTKKVIISADVINSCFCYMNVLLEVYSMFNKFKSERGSITVYVLVAMLFLLAIVTGKYVLANRQLKSQIGALKSIQDVYEKPVMEGQTSSSNTTNSTTTPTPSRDDDTGSEPEKINPIKITDSSIQIPIYNPEAFTYFRSGDTTPYYVYQEGAMYVGGYNKKYKLMSDIVVNYNRSTLYSDSFLNRIDFNNHAIYTNDANFFYGYKRWQSKWWYDPSK